MVEDADDRAKKILDTKCKMADLHHMVQRLEMLLAF